MNDKVTVLLSGLGYYKLSAHRRKQLAIILGASLGIHLLALIIFGSWVVIRSVLEEKTVFVAQPQMKTYEPRKVEHKVKVQKQQRSSSRPSMTPRMIAAKVSDFALPEIKADPKVIQTSFQPKFKPVTGVGLGVGLGTGYGLGGFGTGVSEFNFFGIRGRGDKIAILVDVSVSMVEEQMGGPEEYFKVKNRIGQVVDALNEQALFNVVVFADAAHQWTTEMRPATDANKTAAKAFLAPYNAKGNYGLTSGNVQASTIGKRASGGTTRLDLALTAAFEQNADTILIISDGRPMVQKSATDEELAAWSKRLEEWHKANDGRVAALQAEHAQRMAAWREANAGALQAYQEAMAQMTYHEEKVWVPPRPAQAAVAPQLKEGGGGGGRPASPAQPGYWTTRRVPDRPPPEPPTPPGGPNLPQPPGRPSNLQWWSYGDFVEHFKILHEALYVKKGKRLPVVHCIGYKIDKEGGIFLRDFAKEYKGSYKRVGSVR